MVFFCSRYVMSLKIKGLLLKKVHLNPTDPCLLYTYKQCDFPLGDMKSIDAFHLSFKQPLMVSNLLKAIRKANKRNSIVTLLPTGGRGGGGGAFCPAPSDWQPEL